MTDTEEALPAHFRQGELLFQVSLTISNLDEIGESPLLGDRPELRARLKALSDELRAEFKFLPPGD